MQQRPSQNSANKGQRSVVCIDLDDSDAVDLSPQTYPGSRISTTPLSFTSNTSMGASTSSASATGTGPVEGSGQMNPTRALMHYPSQHQQPSNQSMPYFQNPPVSLVPPPDAVMAGTSNPNYFHTFEQPYPYYQQDYNTRLIAEELRQFMANIQQSTNASNYPRYSS